MIFLAGIAVIVVLGMVERLRPAFPDEAGDLVPISTSIVIQIVMGVTATVIVLTCGVNIKNVVTQSTMTSGLIGLIALFGIAWLADTWIGANETAIVNAMGDLVEQWRWFIAIAIFIVAALTTSQAAALAAIVPIGLALGRAAAVPRRVLHRVHRDLLLPGQRLAGHEHRDRRDGHDAHQQVRHLALVLATDVRHVARVDGCRHAWSRSSSTARRRRTWSP